MWIDEYMFGVIVRERLAEARERAAIEYLVRSARPRARRRRPWSTYDRSSLASGSRRPT